MTGKTEVIILHWNRPRECLDTLKSFQAQSIPTSCTVIDNGSIAESLKALQSQASEEVQFVLLPQNKGFGGGMNVGLRKWLAEKDTEWIVLAPHDALPEINCLERLSDALRRNPKLGIVSAEYGKPVKPSYHWFKGPTVVSTTRGTGLEPIAYPNGTLMVFRRACLQQVGLFDERYFAYTEEYDIARRARSAGWDIGLVWGAVVQNPIRAADSDMTWYLLIRNQLLAINDTSGFAVAALRSVQLLASGILRQMTGRSDEGSKVRLRAIRDFWRGRFGRPPQNSD